MKKILISFSGGRTSAYMAWMMLQKKSASQDFEIVFANTGLEHEETLVFVDRCEKFFGQRIWWVEAVTNPKNGIGTKAKVVDFKTASRNGEPFEAMIAKHGIPNSTTPHCTRELKKYAIRAFARDVLKWKKSEYMTAIGIRADEMHRLNWKTAKVENLIYPLAVDFMATKFDVNHFWSQQDFDLNIKSYEGNCKTCWKKSNRKLMTIAIENPSWFDEFVEWEIKYGEYTPPSRSHNPKIKPPHRFFRMNQSVQDIFEEAKFQFDLATDESKLIDKSKMMQWDLSLDENDGCTESCEVFGEEHKRKPKKFQERKVDDDTLEKYDEESRRF